MWSSFTRRLQYLALGTALTACSSDLTLPGNTPPPDDQSPASLIVVSGDGQEARVGKRLDRPLVVRLIEGSTPLAGVRVEFGFQEPVSGAELVRTNSTTNEEGLASAEVRLGNTAGLHTIEARVTQPTNLVARFGVVALERGGGEGGNGGGGNGGGDDDDEDDD